MLNEIILKDKTGRNHVSLLTIALHASPAYYSRTAFSCGAALLSHWRTTHRVSHYGCTLVQAVVMITTSLIGNGHFWTAGNKKLVNQLSPDFAQAITSV